jgi:predicted MFS family arabinose efflux permease
MKLLLVTQAAAMTIAAVMTALLAAGVIQFWHFIVLAALGGTVFAFVAPLRQSVVARLVRPANLMSAVALNSASFNIMGILGPAAVGLLLAFMPPYQAYLIIGGCFLAGAVMLAFIRLPDETRQAAGPFHLELAEGIRFIMGHRPIMGFLLVALVSSFFIVPNSLLMPALASAVLKVDQVGFGFLCAARGLGALSGSLTAASLNQAKNKGALVLVFLAIYGIFSALSAQFPSYPAALLLVFGAGLTGTIFITLCNTLILTRTPARLHGRVISIYTMAMGLTPIGTLPMGALADGIGLPLTFLMAGSIAVAFVLIMWFSIPSMRKV